MNIIKGVIVQNKINELLSYGLERNLIVKRDVVYCLNSICYLLDVEVDFYFEKVDVENHIDDILTSLATSKLNDVTNTELELFKSKLIDCMIDKPSQVEAKFYDLYNSDKEAATNYLYQFAKDVNYIKEKAIASNIVYTVDSKYGEIDITINLSKPEKSTKEIEMLKNSKSSIFPKCFLCKEEEGLYGSMRNPDRSNHRIIEVELDNEDWYFQYSPYSYFNEHSIVLKGSHDDMKIDLSTFERLLEFTDKFPHYMIGSNADLPIVGGSMLTHDHYQTGRYEFPLFKADTKLIKELGNVTVSSVNWPMHTVKLKSSDRISILTAAASVLQSWISYEDTDNNIIAFSSVRHNTITPIVRYVECKYEMFLILRNNYTNEEFPSGIYHVNSKRHHIKQENIGLIEAMGLAVLPARLKTELATVANIFDNKLEVPEELSKHQYLFECLSKDKPRNSYEYLLDLAGEIFVAGIEDCGVFRYNESKYIEFLEGLVW